jgi:excisionase family DNA binding protein
MDRIIALQDKRLLRVDETAKILSVSRWTVYRWVDAGRLGGTRIGTGSLRIFSETVAALIDLHCVGKSVAAGILKEARSGQVLPVPASRLESNHGRVRPREQVTE